jgi:hypothetical protein
MNYLVKFYLPGAHSDWTFYVQDGDARPSYRVIPALRLHYISLESKSDTNPELQLWEDSIMGLTDRISEENDSKVRQSVTRLCERIIERSKSRIADIRSQVANTWEIKASEWSQVLHMIERLWEEEYYVAEGVRQSTLNGVVF